MLTERAPRVTNREGRPYAKLVSRETGQAIEVAPLVYDALMLSKNPAISGEIRFKIVNGEVNSVVTEFELKTATRGAVEVYLAQAANKA